MNAAKHPRYIRAIGPLPLLVGDSGDAALASECMLLSGIDPARALKTFDGDTVRLIAVDPGHTFPLVGEVVDYHAQVTWLARWSSCGIYATSSADARKKHSIRPNASIAAFGATSLNARPGNEVYTRTPVVHRDGEGIIREAPLTPKREEVTLADFGRSYNIPRHTFNWVEAPAPRTFGPFDEVQGDISVVPKFLMKDPPPLEMKPDRSANVIAAAKRDIRMAVTAHRLGVPIDRISAEVLEPHLHFLQSHGLSADAVIFSRGAMHVVNGAIVIEGDPANLTADQLAQGLGVLESGRVKKVILRVGGGVPQPTAKEASTV